MSTQGLRNFRPALHFTAPQMWLNDPNGLVYADGKYHLFYQHHPAEPVWGPMHWGHATSTDLIHWTHLPIALYPDALGTVFSGSAVYDAENTSGFGTGDATAIVAMYTSHGTSQQQCIAWSLDGIRFEKYAANPVISNPGIADFRDPKVFYNPVKHCWSMVLAAGDRVLFYSSPNLRDWTPTGEFGPEGNTCEGVWECPDLFALPTETGEKWVLLVSMGMPREKGGARTQYFTGTFNGDTFVSDGAFAGTEFIDQGADNYAGVTYHNTDRRIFIGWGVNGSYAGATPTGEFCGIMTLARELSLVRTPSHGYRLAAVPLGLEAGFRSGRTISSGAALSGQVFGMTLQGHGPCRITLRNKENQTLIFGVDDRNCIFVDRRLAGARGFDEAFDLELHGLRSAFRFFDGAYTLQVVFDVSVLECYADEGTRCFSQVVYPDSPYHTVEAEGTVTLTLHDIL